MEMALSKIKACSKSCHISQCCVQLIQKRNVWLLHYSRGVITAGSSACFIWQTFFLNVGCPSWRNPKGNSVSSQDQTWDLLVREMCKSLHYGATSFACTDWLFCLFVLSLLVALITASRGFFIPLQIINACKIVCSYSVSTYVIVVSVHWQCFRWCFRQSW